MTYLFVYFFVAIPINSIADKKLWCVSPEARRTIFTPLPGVVCNYTAISNIFLSNNHPPHHPIFPHSIF